MIAVLDTEFTDLAINPRLLSVGHRIGPRRCARHHALCDARERPISYAAANDSQVDQAVLA